jgi:antitoxin ParD1/3/4
MLALNGRSSDMPTLTISLPESLRDFIDHQVKTKGYGNTSEYLRSLLREAQEEEADRRLQSLLLEGLESGGDDLRVNEKFWAELRVEAAALIAKNKKRP